MLYQKCIRMSSQLRAVIFADSFIEHPVILNYAPFQRCMPIFFCILKLHSKMKFRRQANG